MQHKLTRTIQNTVYRGKFLEIILHPFDNSHDLTILVLHHSALFEGFCKNSNFRHRTKLLYVFVF